VLLPTPPFCHTNEAIRMNQSLNKKGSHTIKPEEADCGGYEFLMCDIFMNRLW
jgi:hypothetical protein